MRISDWSSDVCSSDLGSEKSQMNIEHTPRSKVLAVKLDDFMADHIYPNEHLFFLEAERLGPWELYPVVEQLKHRARDLDLWNLFLPAKHHPGGLTNVEYAGLCEIMGRSFLATEVFNCNAPETGNLDRKSTRLNSSH